MIDNQLSFTQSVVFDNIKNILENSMIKISSEASQYETIDILRSAERYLNAKQELDRFESYPLYEPSVISKAGITDREKIYMYHENKYLIPRNKRNLVLKYKRELIIKEYEEQNDYYRELIGKPPVNEKESEYFYLTESQMKFYDIDEVRPIHDYPSEIISKLERKIIPDLIANNPDKKYLQHMGSKSVDLVTARNAKNFQIIYFDSDIDKMFIDKFFETYTVCRDYYVSVIYNSDLKSVYPYYDNFIAMNIMMMTIQRFIVDIIQMSVDRDFFDLMSVKKMFNVYGLPFFETLPMDYQRIIIKHLNIMVRTKSTDQCLYDIANTLMYERISVYKYFLVKERLMDDNGIPIMATKKITNDDGTTTEVPDYEKMYDVYFQSTDIMDNNTILAIEDKTNRYEYKEVTEEDDLWWDDADLKKELYEREFNYIDTKYIGISISYNLTKILYESIYFLNMLIDNKDVKTDIDTRLFNEDAMHEGTDYLYIKLERITDTPISIFDSIVILATLLCKKNSMKGNILVKPAEILSVLGFNFEANFDLINKKIRENPRIFKHPEITKYLNLLNIETVEDINNLYNNFKNFANFCIEQMNTTNDIKVFRAYQDLYRTLMIKKETTKAFKLNNGLVAISYMEYVRDKLPHIADYIDSLEKDECGVIIEHILGKLNELIPSLTYLSTLNGVNNNIVECIIELIKFFKSYTVDLRNLNVVYVFDDPYWNRIRSIENINLHVKIQPREKPQEYNDINFVHSNYDVREKVRLSYVNALDDDGNGTMDKMLMSYNMFNTRTNNNDKINVRDKLQIIYD